MAGKDKCEFLKGIRKRIAEANGIAYEPRECTFEGDCTGTCPFCEKEAADLLAALKKKEAEGTEIKRDDVGILAIEQSENDCEGTDKDQCNEIVLTGAEGNLLIKDDAYNAFASEVERINETFTPVGRIRCEDDVDELRRREQEDMERIMREQEKPLLGHIIFKNDDISKAREDKYGFQQKGDDNNEC